MASRAASTMCSSRIRSRGCVEHLGFRENFRPESLTQVAGRAQIDLRAQQSGKFEFEFGQADEPHPDIRLELYQEVNVALRPGFAMQDRSEQRQPPHPVGATEVSQCVALDVSWIHAEMVQQPGAPLAPPIDPAVRNAPEHPSGYAGSTYPPRRDGNAAWTQEEIPHDRTRTGFAG